MMKKMFAALLAALMLLSSAALADTRISVQGQGAVQVSPDLALEEIGEDVAAIQAAVNGKTNAVIDALTGEGGMAEADIRTENYAIYRYYGYDYEKDQAPQYAASCMLRLTLRDVDKAGAIIDLAFANGANMLNNISFSIADDGELADKALALAVADGIHRAQVIAAAAGITLPAVPTQVTEGSGVYYGERAERAWAEDSAVNASTKLMSGMVEITASVTVTYEIDD